MKKLLFCLVCICAALLGASLFGACKENESYIDGL